MIIKKIGLSICLTFILLFITSCASNEVNNINVNELEDLLDKEYQFIDIRTSAEYNGSTDLEHLTEFNINIDYYKLVNDYSLLNDLDKEIAVVLICNSGNRSSSAVSIFQDQGFDEIYNVEGGMVAWSNK